ncbi:MAG TPA: tetratricopeptide repeat protein, partial [Candidatus Acidoferrales bacterium]|nr:tetratricopeptide repeat protein [Candidatus Acidoferrales bacterium]
VISGRMGTNDQFIELHRHSDAADAKRSRPPVPLLTGKTREEIDAAVEALRADDAAKAAPHIDFALKHAPADPNVQYYAGVYSQRIKDLPAAKQHFETAIAIYPDHYGAQLDLGSLLLQLQNDPAGAIPHFEKALSLQPDSWLAHWFEAEANLRMHDPANAKTHASRAIELGKEKSAGAAVTLARAQAMSGDREGARKTLEEFVRKYPQDPNVGRAQALLNSPAFSPSAANTSHPNS